MSSNRQPQCPKCFDELAVIEMAPCHECGHFPEEIEHCRAGQHEYAEYFLLGRVTLNLCNICFLDMDSYSIGQGRTMDIRRMDFVRAIPPQSLSGAVCTNCNMQPQFFEFVDTFDTMIRENQWDELSKYTRRT